MTDTTKQIASFDPGRVLQDQVAAWTKERDRLQQLIDTATGRATPVSPAQSDPVFVNQLQEAIFAARSIDGREDYWNDVLARLGVTAPAKPHSDLHSAIMNLPCNAGRAIAMNGPSMQAYKEGHRDARHAAAELAAASVGAQVAGEPVTLSIGVSVDSHGASVCVMQRYPEGNITALYSGTHPVGDSMGVFTLCTAPIGSLEPSPAPQQKPIARLQSYVSDRPYSEGQQFFEVVILDQERCADGMELFGTPVPAPATVDRDAVLEEAAYALNQHMSGMPMAGSAVVMGCMRVIRELKGKAAPEEKAETLESSWSGDDGEALIHLAPNFTDTAGLLQPKAGYTPTAQDFAAINYLCNEWDYGYDAAPAAVPQGVDSQCRNALINRKAGAYPKSCPRCGLAKDCPAGVVIDFSQGVEQSQQAGKEGA